MFRPQTVGVTKEELTQLKQQSFWIIPSRLCTSWIEAAIWDHRPIFQTLSAKGAYVERSLKTSKMCRITLSLKFVREDESVCDIIGHPIHELDLHDWGKQIFIQEVTPLLCRIGPEDNTIGGVFIRGTYQEVFNRYCMKYEPTNV